MVTVLCLFGCDGCLLIWFVIYWLASGEFAGFVVIVAVLSFFGLSVLLVVVSFGIGFLLFVLLVGRFLMG